MPFIVPDLRYTRRTLRKSPVFTYLPARRAPAVNAMAALRAE